MIPVLSVSVTYLVKLWLSLIHALSYSLCLVMLSLSETTRFFAYVVLHLSWNKNKGLLPLMF